MNRTTRVWLIRHAKAGSRSRWDGPDEARPLTKVGRRQADGIAAQLGAIGATRILSSPYVRCRQTVEPLGATLGVSIESADPLAEGTPLSEALRLVEKVSDEPTVLCTHGDVIGELLEHMHRAGVVDSDVRFEKGSTWALDTDAGSVVRARYLAPPS